MGIFSGKIEYSPKWVNLSGTLTQWYIFEKTSHLFLLGKFGPKIWCSPNYLKFKTVIHCHQPIAFLAFIISIFFPFNFFGQISSQNWKFFKWTKFSTDIHCFVWILVLTFVLSKFLPFKLFWTNLGSKSNVIWIEWNLTQLLQVEFFFTINDPKYDPMIQWP